MSVNKKEFNWIESVPSIPKKKPPKYRPFVAKVLWIENHVFCKRAFKNMQAATRFATEVRGRVEPL